MVRNKNDNDYPKVDLHEQHKAIVSYLRYKFKQFIENQNLDFDSKGNRPPFFKEKAKKTLFKFFEVVCDSFGRSYKELNYEKKLGNPAETSRNVKRLNFFLWEFSNDNDIDSEHPIQLFSYHEESSKVYQVNFHFACARVGVADRNRKYSTDNITLEEALRCDKVSISSEPQIKRLKYLRDMRDVLKWNDETEPARWFRKSGPIAADFKAGYVYEQKKLLEKLNELVFNNNISILEGNGGVGKSVLVRNFAYNLINKDETKLIYHYSFKTDAQIVDFHDFLSILNSLTGIVIIEDMHLATPDMQHIVDRFDENDFCRILLTARPSFKETIIGHFPNKLENLAELKLTSSKTANEIIDFYIKNKPEPKISWTKDIIKAILEVSEGNLWLLSYALKGCSGQGSPISWIRDGVVQDLRDLENHGTYKCNSEILLALSPLYMNEVLTDQTFLIKELGYDRKEIDRLVSLGEIIKHKTDRGIFYGLPHSSSALAYWQFGDEYRTCLKYSDYEEFVYQYVISGASNSLDYISNTENVKLLDRLAIERRALDVIQKLKDPGCIIGFFTSIITKRFKINEYYTSKQFVQGYADILFQKRYLYEFAILLQDYPLWAGDIWGHIDSKIFSKYLFSNITFGLPLLGSIFKANKDMQSTICELLKDISFNFNLTSYLSTICVSLGALYEIDAIAVEKELDKLDIDELAEVVQQNQVSDVILPQWLQEYDKYFYEIRDKEYVFRTNYSVELLLIFLRTYTFKNKRVKKLLSKLDISILKRLAKNCPAIAKMEFLLLMCKIDTSNASQFKDIIASNIKRYSDNFMFIRDIKEAYFDDQIFETDAMVGQKLYKYIYKKIGIDKYINKILGTASKELYNKCYKFLLSVDPDNKQGWKRFFDNTNQHILP